MINDKERLIRYRRILNHKSKHKQIFPYMDCIRCPAKKHLGDCPNRNGLNCWVILKKWAEGKLDGWKYNG